MRVCKVEGEFTFSAACKAIGASRACFSEARINSRSKAAMIASVRGLFVAGNGRREFGRAKGLDWFVDDSVPDGEVHLS